MEQVCENVKGHMEEISQHVTKQKADKEVSLLDFLYFSPIYLISWNDIYMYFILCGLKFLFLKDKDFKRIADCL